MVDQASRINVEESLEKKEWTSEQFNAILSQFTDQVNLSCYYFVLLLIDVKIVQMSLVEWLMNDRMIMEINVSITNS